MKVNVPGGGSVFYCLIIWRLFPTAKERCIRLCMYSVVGSVSVCVVCSACCPFLLFSAANRRENSQTLRHAKIGQVHPYLLVNKRCSYVLVGKIAFVFTIYIYVQRGTGLALRMYGLGDFFFFSENVGCAKSAVRV